MQQLNQSELATVNGGAIAAASGILIWKILAMLGIGVVGIGIFDGITNPLKCRR